MDEQNEQLKRFKQAMQDIRYIIKMYKGRDPAVTLDCVSKLANDKKLRLKNINPNQEEA